MSKHRRKNVCGDVCARSVSGLLGRYSQYLLAQGFSASRRCCYLRVVEHFGRWLGRRAINRPQVQEFLDHGLPHCQCPGVSRYRRSNRAALNHLLRLLGQNPNEATRFRGWRGELLDRYEKHLVAVRGLSPATICQHLRYTRAMLIRLKVRQSSQFLRWTPDLIERYVASSRCRHIGWCARSFLRFLLQEGFLQRDLTLSVPTVARWRLASLPTTLRPEEIRRLIQAAEHKTPVGKRDYAILMGLSELGLRGADIAHLELGNVDFSNRVLRVHQRKEREAAAFPMTPQLTAALKDYLRNGRPACSSSAVFVRHHAPLGKPLTPMGICQVVLRLARQAGMQHRVHGAHIFRRSLASRMLNSGAKLKQIADFLGHTSIDTTTLYTKVDMAKLSRVALPWPVRKEVRR